MDKEDVAGRVIHYMALLVPSLVIIYSLFFSTGDTEWFGIYNLVWYGTRSVHSFSLIVMCASFLVHYSRMKYLMPLARFVITLSFRQLYAFVGGTFWMVNSYLVRGSGLILTNVLGIFAVIFLIDRLDDKHGVLRRYDLTKRARAVVLVILLLQLVAYVGMWKTGFWELMELDDMGMAPHDPNRNPFWVLMRVTSFWFILPLISRSDYKAPLRLDPRVLIW